MYNIIEKITTENSLQKGIYVVKCRMLTQQYITRDGIVLCSFVLAFAELRHVTYLSLWACFLLFCELLLGKCVFTKSKPSEKSVVCVFLSNCELQFSSIDNFA